MRAMKMLVVLSAAAGAVGVTAAVASAAGGVTRASASTATAATLLPGSGPGRVGPAAADHAVVSYVTAHHPGPGTARVLATEPDTDRGQAVYDVRVLAPDGFIYEVHVSQASGAVLWANWSEEQGASPAASAQSSERMGEDSGGHVEDDAGPGGTGAGTSVGDH